MIRPLLVLIALFSVSTPMAAQNYVRPDIDKDKSTVIRKLNFPYQEGLVLRYVGERTTMNPYGEFETEDFAMTYHVFDAPDIKKFDVVRFRLMTTTGFFTDSSVVDSTYLYVYKKGMKVWFHKSYDDLQDKVSLTIRLPLYKGLSWTTPGYSGEKTEMLCTNADSVILTPAGAIRVFVIRGDEYQKDKSTDSEFLLTSYEYYSPLLGKVGHTFTQKIKIEDRWLEVFREDGMLESYTLPEGMSKPDLTAKF